MSLIENIAAACGMDADLAPEDYRVTLFGGRSGYFEGVKGIASFSEGEVVLFLKKGRLTVTGEKLTLGKFCEGDLVICGNIFRLERGQ